MSILNEFGANEAMLKKLGRVGGYAYGHYTCRCLSCDAQFFGEKRAYQCLPCATKTLTIARDILKEDAERLNRPDMFWDWERPEDGSCDCYEDFTENYGGSDVVRYTSAKSLPDVWVTTRVLTVDKNGDPDKIRTVAFSNRDEAEVCWSTSLVKARADMEEN